MPTLGLTIALSPRPLPVAVLVLPDGVGANLMKTAMVFVNPPESLQMTEHGLSTAKIPLA
jgi:23S rRNA A2030 N6-methylase RlmJ